MSAQIQSRLGRVAHTLSLVVLVAVTVRLSVVVAMVSAARVRFPFDIDWIEGGQLVHALRILEGRPIYGAADFLPHPYPPLHYLVLAAVGSMTGLGFVVGRMVSVIAGLVAVAIGCAALFREARRGPDVWWTGAVPAGALVVAAVGLVLRTYPYAVGWFDLVRSDALLLALVAAAAGFATSDRRAALMAAGLCLAAAVFTKQTAIFFAPTLALFVALRSRRQAAWLVASLIVPSLVAFVWLDVTSRGAFHGWLLSTQGHRVEASRLAGGAWIVLKACPHLLGAAPLAWLARGRFGRVTQAVIALWIGAVPACLLPYAKTFGVENNLVPLLVLSALVPLSFAIDAWRERRHQAIYIALVAIAILAIASARLDERRLRPGDDVTRAMAANLAEVKALPGTIACPVHPFLAHQLGKGSAQSSWHSFLDARAAGRPVDRDRFLEDLIALDADWIVLTNMPAEAHGHLQEGIGAAYVWDHNFSTPRTGEPVTFHSVPRMAFRRRRDH